MLGNEGDWKALYHSFKEKINMPSFKGKVDPNRRRIKRVNPGRAAEGSQLEETAIAIVQRKNKDYRATYLMIIQSGPLHNSVSESGYQVEPSLTLALRNCTRTEITTVADHSARENVRPVKGDTE